MVMRLHLIDKGRFLFNVYKLALYPRENVLGVHTYTHDPDERTHHHRPPSLMPSNVRANIVKGTSVMNFRYLFYYFLK